MKQNIKSYSVIMLLILFTAFVNVKSQSVDSVDSTENKSIMFMDSANDPSSPHFIPKWHNMFTNIPNDWLKYFSVTWNENKIPLYLTVAALTAATIVTD
ncbi:MAG: hypothetical protein HY963_04510, partial [Ignavibacteriales bacterium]|nr:hypothetical protein [Ignavibacteriales bacterium]